MTALLLFVIWLLKRQSYMKSDPDTSGHTFMVQYHMRTNLTAGTSLEGPFRWQLQSLIY